VWIDSSWWIFRKSISQLVDFSEKHFAAGGFLLGGIEVPNFPFQVSEQKSFPESIQD